MIKTHLIFMSLKTKVRYEINPGVRIEDLSLTVPRRRFCYSSFSFSIRWFPFFLFSTKCCLLSFYVIIPSSCALGRLRSMIIVFPGYFNIIFYTELIYLNTI